MQARRIVVAFVASCVVTACSSGTERGGEGGGDCVFGVEWNGVNYVDPAAYGHPADPPAVSGHYLGLGHGLCTDGRQSGTIWRLYSVPGVSSDVAVTTEDTKYLAIAEGRQLPEQLRRHPTRASEPPPRPTPGGNTTYAGPRSHVPPEFRHACGHPGSRVMVRRVPVVIRHADCDLTGVRVTYRNYGGTTIGTDPGGVGMSSGLEVEVAVRTLDVSIRAPKGGPGNA